MGPEITVAIPVGPVPGNRTWLSECLESVAVQTYPATEVLLIDDMAGLTAEVFKDLMRQGNVVVSSRSERETLSDGCVYHLVRKTTTGKNNGRLNVPVARIWQTPWNVGVATAFNFGVALAMNDLVIMLGSDDTLTPDCLEECARCYTAQPRDKRDRTYYWMGLHYMGTEKNQFLPCNAAMVPKQLWNDCGGFPVETAVGAPDAALISVMMTHPEAGRLIGVAVDRKPLYNYRSHPDTDTARRKDWYDIMMATRNLLTKNWTPPRWDRKGLTANG